MQRHGVIVSNPTMHDLNDASYSIIVLQKYRCSAGLPTFSGEKLLDLPPLLDGPRGKMSNSTTGGLPHHCSLGLYTPASNVAAESCLCASVSVRSFLNLNVGLQFSFALSKAQSKSEFI